MHTIRQVVAVAVLAASAFQRAARPQCFRGTASDAACRNDARRLSTELPPRRLPPKRSRSASSSCCPRLATTVACRCSATRSRPRSSPATWQAPTDGAQIDDGDGGRKTWHTATAEADGTLNTARLRGGYAYATYDSPAEQVVLLEATGDAAVYVNGEPHTGDPYGLGWVELPVLLKRGENTFLFHFAGERFSAKLVPPPAATCSSSTTIARCPRCGVARRMPVWAALPVVNASRDWLEGAQIECHHGGGETLATPVRADPAAVGAEDRFSDSARSRCAAGDEVDLFRAARAAGDQNHVALRHSGRDRRAVARRAARRRASPHVQEPHRRQRAVLCDPARLPDRRPTRTPARPDRRAARRGRRRTDFLKPTSRRSHGPTSSRRPVGVPTDSIGKTGAALMCWK